MRQPDFDALVEIVEPDQATQIGLFDGIRVDDPPQRSQLDRLTDRQRIDNGADRIGQGAHARLDQLDQSVRHRPAHRPTANSRSARARCPSATACSTMCRRYRMLPCVSCHRLAGGVRVHRSVQRRRQKRRRLVRGQWFKIDSLELAELPKFLYRNRNRLIVPQSQQDLRDVSLHDLIQNEHRQIVEQVRVVHTHHDGAGRRRGSQRVDHAAHQLQAVVADQPRPRRQRTQRDSPPARGPDHPTDFATPGRGARQRLAPYPALSHARRAADDHAGRIRVRERGLDEPHLLPAPG